MTSHAGTRTLVTLAMLALVVGLIPLVTGQTVEPRAREVVKTDAEWRRQLTRAQYEVTRRKGTEPAFSGRYAVGHHKGVFTCVCCDAALFSSAHKFDSGTGWPSFWQPIRGEALETEWDNRGFEPRVEVICSRCGAHLGHVFSDGPPPTGLRYCINSVALKLRSSPAAVPRKTAKAKAKPTATSEEARGDDPRGAKRP